jgi:hypothetical protein
MLNVRRATHDFHRKRSGPLQTQITRSSEAIPNNIVEGCFAATQKEFARYLDISIKSSGETEYQRCSRPGFPRAPIGASLLSAELPLIDNPDSAWRSKAESGSGNRNVRLN